MAKTPKNENNGSVPADAIPMHKRLSMGQKPETGSGTGKKTPA